MSSLTVIAAKLPTIIPQNPPNEKRAFGASFWLFFFMSYGMI